MEKILEFYEHSWFMITWILEKSNSIQILVEDLPEIKLSHRSLLNKTYRNSHWIIPSRFYPNNRLVSLRILSYRESTVVAPISSLAIDKILFSSWWLYSCDFQQKTISGVFVQLSKKPHYFCPFSKIEMKFGYSRKYPNTGRGGRRWKTGVYLGIS